MNKTMLMLIAGASALAVAASAYANYRDMKDGDWENRMTAHFEQMDANGDGNVDHDEFIAFQAKMNEQRWQWFSSEAGDDGVVSLEEAKAHHDAMMKGGKGMGSGMGPGMGMGPNCDGTGPHGKMGEMMDDGDSDEE